MTPSINQLQWTISEMLFPNRIPEVQPLRHAHRHNPAIAVARRSGTRSGQYKRRSRSLLARLHRLTTGDSGMSTAEYAIGTIAAAAFAGLLYAVVTGDSVLAGLTQLIEQALSGPR